MRTEIFVRFVRHRNLRFVPAMVLGKKIDLELKSLTVESLDNFVFN